jgi:hypothetical protein
MSQKEIKKQEKRNLTVIERVIELSEEVLLTQD